MSDFHEAFYRRAKDLIPGFLFDQVKSQAVPLSGASARWKSSAPTVFEKIVLPELHGKLPTLEDKELKTVLQRVNKLFVSARRSKGETDVFRKAAAWVVKEMRNRGLTIDHKLAVLQQFIGKSDEEIADELNLDHIEKHMTDNTGAPINPRGFNVPETLKLVEENGKWSQEEANYIPRSPDPYRSCAGCRFFVRDGAGSNGKCQVVDGDINWYGTSDFHICAKEDAAYAYAVMHQAAQEAMMDAAFSLQKASEGDSSDDDNNTDPKAPKVVYTVKELVEKRIKQEGNEWVVTDQSGKKELGRHKSKADAIRQLVAIEERMGKGCKDDVEKAQPTVGQLADTAEVGRDPELDKALRRMNGEEAEDEVVLDEEGQPLQKEDVEFLVPIAKIDDEKKKIYGIVLEPDEVDTQGDTISTDEIEKAAEGFMKRARTIGLGHKQIAKDVTLTDSYVTQGPTTLGKTSLKPGTWIIGVKVDNDTIWKGVKSGDYTGFSVGGYGKRKKNA